VAVSRRPTTLATCSVHTPHTPHAGRQAGRHTPPTDFLEKRESVGCFCAGQTFHSLVFHPFSPYFICFSLARCSSLLRIFFVSSLSGFFGDKNILKNKIL
jgi:hypothetical protein